MARRSQSQLPAERLDKPTDRMTRNVAGAMMRRESSSRGRCTNGGVEESVVAADRLRDALSELVDDGQLPASVRTEISDSWRRSVQAGLRPDRLEVPFDPT